MSLISDNSSKQSTSQSKTLPTKLDQATIERELFVPGEFTLARSDEQSNPLDINEMVRIFQGPNPPHKRIYVLPFLHKTLEAKKKVTPQIDDLIDTHERDHGVDIHGFSLCRLSDLYYDYPEEEYSYRVWLIIHAKDQEIQGLKKLAKAIGDLFKSTEDLTEVECVILKESFRYL